MKNTARINRSLMAVLALVVTLGILLLSCGDDAGPTTSITPSDPVFRQLGALSTVTSWEKVWGASASDMFIMGEDALVYQRNGLNWDSLNSTGTGKRVMRSAWGDAANNAYFVGGESERTRPDTVKDADGNPILDDDGKVQIVDVPIADRPILSHYNGSNFLEVSIDFEWGLYDIWGAAADTIFAVGFDGSIIQYDGADWTIMATGGTTPAWLNAVWGTSGSSVYTSGTDGALLHYDGSSWSVIPSHSVEDLWDVWGFSDSSVYCVGSGGTVLHYDGSSVTRMTTPVTNRLYSIWGYAENDLYAVGWSGTIIHYDGSIWT